MKLIILLYFVSSLAVASNYNPDQYPNIQLKPDSLTYYANGKLKCGNAMPNSFVALYNTQLHIPSMSSVCFHRNSSLKSFRVLNNFNFTKQGKTIRVTQALSQSSNLIKFNENKEIIYVNRTSSYVDLKAGKHTFKVKGELKFSPENAEDLTYASHTYSIPISLTQGTFNNYESITLKNNKIIGIKVKPKHASTFQLANRSLQIYGEITLDEQERISSAILTKDTTFKVVDHIVKVKGNLNDKQNKENPYTYFHTKGLFKKGELVESAILKIGGHYGHYHQVEKDNWVEFTTAGHLIAASISGPYTRLEFRNGLRQRITCGPGEIKFYPNQALKSCTTDLKYQALHSNLFFGPIRINRQKQIAFNKNGFLIESGDRIYQKIFGTDAMVIDSFSATESENILTARIEGIVSLELQRKQVQFGSHSFPGNLFKFHPHKNLALKEAVLAEEIVLDVIGGQKRFYPGETICINEQELAASKSNGQCNW